MRLRFAAQTLRRLLDHGLAYAAAHLRPDIFERFGEVGILHAADLVVKAHAQLRLRNAGIIKSSPGCGSASSDCRSSDGGSAGFLSR
jgi:hypothetical protein